jgi:2-methylcitrate dehydratase PrpD
MGSGASALATDTLAEFAAGALAGQAGDRLAIHIADGLIALLAGQQSAEGQSLSAFFKRTESSVLATLSANAAAMRLSEIDDIHRASGVTASAIALPSALAMTAFVTLDSHVPQRFADAVMVGQSVSIELALAMGGARLMAQGMWPTYLVAPAGAAAAAGRMLGLPASRMRHALAIALAQTPRSVGRSSGSRPARWLLFANSVRSGCLAALAAADGVDGDVGLLDEAWLKSVGGTAAAASVAAPVLRVHELSIKPHCAAKQTLCAIQGLKSLMAEGLDAATIESITVSVPPAYAAMIDREPPTASRLASMVSVRWQLALTALQPELLDDVSRDTPPTQGLSSFADKVSVRVDASLDSGYPAQWPAHLLVKAAGRSYEALVKDSPGDPAMPFAVADVEDKARRMLKNHRDAALVSVALDATTGVEALQQFCSRFFDAGISKNG